MSGFVIDEENYLQHYGIQRKSGRYPWGSGGDVQQRSRDFLGLVADYRKQGLSDTEIAKSFSTPDHPFTTTMLRATTSIARNQKRAADIIMAERLKAKGYSNGAIAERMGLAGESSVRALLEPGLKERNDQLQSLASMLKEQISENEYRDVGIGTERYTGSSRTQFDTALSILKSEGYQVISVPIDQVGTGHKTLVKVLAPPGVVYKDVVSNKDRIKPLSLVKTDGNELISDPPPLSISSKRIDIRYSEKNSKGEEIGGGTADGVIYVRPGVKDVSLGGARYAQVRVAVDGSHYLKGMAVYKDDLPPGVDLQFHTNKSDTGNKLDALKPMKDDPGDPFGAATKKPLLNPDGTRKSAMNIVNEEGDWASWSKSLASQMLSKQRPTLAKEQLNKAYINREKDLNEILSLTNPSVKKKLLESFADDADSSAVHLKAAHMDRQATQVIIPIKRKGPKDLDGLGDTEIYAPQFRDGERVALIRYPHGGTFEIPELIVNNKNPEGIRILGSSPKDAVGINHKVADRLSGADFDGDTVLVIPNNVGKIKSTPPLESLKNFDAKREYPFFDGMKTMTPKQKQTEMGKVSNLITDMTIKGANPQEIARAVRHSMVVIDAEKHNLNYKQSYIDNGIKQLKIKYQGVTEKGQPKGASTLISRTTSEVRVPKRKQSFKIDPITGEKTYNPADDQAYIDRKGKLVIKTSRSQLGAETRDAHVLSSGTPVEKVYADYSNDLKALANTARREMVSTSPIPYSSTASKVYAKEVAKLNADLNVALKNAPLERQAQIIANAVVKQKRDANPEMGHDELKKEEAKALANARARIGSGKSLINITDDQWEAIQAGSISGHKLDQVLRNSNLDRLKQLATPRQPTVMTESKQVRARQLLSSGRTPSEVAQILGVALSTLNSSMNGEEL